VPALFVPSAVAAVLTALAATLSALAAVLAALPIRMLATLATTLLLLSGPLTAALLLAALTGARIVLRVRVLLVRVSHLLSPRKLTRMTAPRRKGQREGLNKGSP
jgi:hypothetical protein